MRQDQGGAAETLSSRIRRRYAEDPARALDIADPVLALLLDHRSVRAYLPTPLAEGALETLVAAAQSAPTSSNVQAFSVVAVEDHARKERLAKLADNQRHIAAAPLLLLWVADLARAEMIARQEGRTLEGLDFTETFLLATIDAAIAAQNAATAAEALGLGTVFIGAFRNHPAEVAAEIGLPRRAYVVTGLVVGHPDPGVETGVKPRLPQDAVLHRERYSIEGMAGAVARHDGHAVAFRKRHGLSPFTWTRILCDRLATIESLKGRHLLRPILERMGFGFK